MADRGITPFSARDGERIALYGSLMRGLGGMTELGLEGALELLGACEIRGRLFDLGPYPGLRPGPGRVRGELYRLADVGLLERLDAFEDFDPERPDASAYLRRRVSLLEPHGTPAWVYVYNLVPSPERWIRSGDWRAHLARRAARITG